MCRYGREGVWPVCRYGREGGDVGERKRDCASWVGKERIVFCEEECRMEYNKV